MIFVLQPLSFSIPVNLMCDPLAGELSLYSTLDRITPNAWMLQGECRLTAPMSLLPVAADLFPPRLTVVPYSL